MLYHDLDVDSVSGDYTLVWIMFFCLQGYQLYHLLLVHHMYLQMLS
jgi:hypothetical protein